MNSDLKISILIITYNRANDMLELVQSICSLEYKEYLYEVIIVNNKSTEDYKQVEDFLKAHSDIPFKYFVTKENLGVTGGRNFAIRKSQAPILVFIDDDALFQNKDAILQIGNIFADKENKVPGIVTFKISYLSTLQLQKNAFPHKRFKEKKDLHRFDTYYFTGCAHAIRKDVFEKVGYYPENFFYGMEEYDLSYRAINSYFTIKYDDRVSILHKESPFGRLPNSEKLRRMWINKTRVAWRYLPKKYFYTTAILWSLQYLRNTNWYLAGWFTGWRKIFKIPHLEKRKVLNKQALSYLKHVKARLWY
jgi:GT2 family glycosyltransferase